MGQTAMLAKREKEIEELEAKIVALVAEGKDVELLKAAKVKAEADLATLSTQFEEAKVEAKTQHDLVTKERDNSRNELTETKAELASAKAKLANPAFKQADVDGLPIAHAPDAGGDDAGGDDADNTWLKYQQLQETDKAAATVYWEKHTEEIIKDHKALMAEAASK